MQCGHCVAVCPESALTLRTINESLQFATFAEKSQWQSFGHTDTSDLVCLMRSRRSCRNYSDTIVPKGVLEDLVKIGTTAPSGTNSQAWTFTILPDRPQLMALGEKVANFYRNLNNKAQNPLLRIMAKLFFNDALGRYYRRYYHSIEQGLRGWDDKGEDLLFHGASAAILIGAEKRASCPCEDALLATQNILLAAHSMGLGSCLIGFVVEAARRDHRIRQFLEMEQGEALYSVIALGYPAEQYERVAGRKEIVPRYLSRAD